MECIVNSVIYVQELMHIAGFMRRKAIFGNADVSALANMMADIIDIDAGAIIRGEKTIEEMGEDILEYCIRAASGEVVPKAVLLNQDDFIPWKRGVSL